MDLLRKNIGDRIKALRTTRDLSQEELAGLMERSVFTISQIERGKSLPRIETLMDFSMVFKCSIDDIVFDSASTATKQMSRDTRCLHNEIWAELMTMDQKTLQISLAALKGIAAAK